MYFLSLHFQRSEYFLQEENETNLWNEIFAQISRTPGNAVPIMAQKSLLGHSKGGSAAWQMAGLLQTVTSGIIPGNHPICKESLKYKFLEEDEDRENEGNECVAFFFFLCFIH
jgi:3-oxoacyl-(acyl-carrier-protein) synthase